MKYDKEKCIKEGENMIDIIIEMMLDCSEKKIKQIPRGNIRKTILIEIPKPTLFKQSLGRMIQVIDEIIDKN